MRKTGRSFTVKIERIEVPFKPIILNIENEQELAVLAIALGSLSPEKATTERDNRDHTGFYSPEVYRGLDKMSLHDVTIILDELAKALCKGDM